MPFKTTAAYVSGAICGPIWWPVGALCAHPGNHALRGPFGAMDGNNHKTFRDALNSLLTRHGGDFQNAQFTADTVIRIERKCVDAPGKYRVHVKEIPLSDLPDCGDLINESAFTGDFMGEE